MDTTTITLYQDRYEQLLDIETRVNIIKNIYEINDYITDSDLCLILGIKRKPKEETKDE